MLSHETGFEQRQEAFIEIASRELLNLKRGNGHLRAVRSITEGSVSSLVTRRVAARVWPHAVFEQPESREDTRRVFGRLFMTNDSTGLLKTPDDLLDPKIYPLQIHLTTQANSLKVLSDFAVEAKRRGWDTIEIRSGVVAIMDPFRRPL